MIRDSIGHIRYRDGFVMHYSAKTKPRWLEVGRVSCESVEDHPSEADLLRINKERNLIRQIRKDFEEEWE